MLCFQCLFPGLQRLSHQFPLIFDEEVAAWEKEELIKFWCLHLQRCRATSKLKFELSNRSSVQFFDQAEVGRFPRRYSEAVTVTSEQKG